MIVPITIDLAEIIAPRLRESDRIEISAVQGRDMDWSQWAKRVAEMDGYGMVGLVAGTPFVMGGFCEVPTANGDVCGVWMVATPVIDTGAGSAVAARVVAQGHREAAKRYSHAITWSDTGNDDGMRLLVRLGYQPVDAPCKLGGRLFQQMRKELR